jgi:hypothetical protein
MFMGKDAASKVRDIINKYRLELIDFILQDVEPLVFEIKYTKKEDYDDNDLYMHPFSEKDFTESEWNHITARAREETKIAGVVRLRNLVAVVRQVLGGEFFRNCIPIRMLKHYWTYLMENVKEKEYEGVKVKEPYVESFNGNVSDIQVDSMVTTRIFTLIQGAFILKSFNMDNRYFNYQGLEIRLSRAYNELFQFIFDDPWGNTQFLKKHTSTLKTVSHALTPIGKGQVIKWDLDMKLKEFIVVPADFNDKVAFTVLQKEVLDEAKELKNAGLVKVGQWLASLITAEANNETMAQAALAQFF